MCDNDEDEKDEIPTPCCPPWCCYIPNCIAEGRLEDHQVPDKGFEKQLDDFHRLMNHHHFLIDAYSDAMEFARQNCCIASTTPVVPLPPMCPPTPYFMRYNGITVMTGCPPFGANVDANQISKRMIYPWNGIMTLNGIRCDYQMCLPPPPADPDAQLKEPEPKYPPCPEITPSDPWAYPKPWEFPVPIGPEDCDPNMLPEGETCDRGEQDGGGGEEEE